MNDDAIEERYQAIHFPLPLELRSKLLSEHFVQRALARNHSPAVLSTIKWRRLHHVAKQVCREVLPLAFFRDLHQSIGFRTCALCLHSQDSYVAAHGQPKTSYDKCSVCAFSAIDQCTKPDSTYAKLDAMLGQVEKRLERHQIWPREEQDYQQRLVRYCEEMFNNLCRLLPPRGATPA